MNFSKDKFIFKVKDHSVSGEEFELWMDKEWELLVTHPQPTPEQLPSYYESADYISHTDGKRTLFEKAYQFVKGIALANKLQLINSLSPKGAILDIGAGTGDFLLTCKNDGWQVTGIEPSTKAQSIAMSKGITMTASQNDLTDHSFDVITMWHVLEHVPDLDAQLHSLKRLLKPEGTVIIAVPNFKSYDAHHYQSFWAAYDVPIHLWHFSKIAIEKLFAQQAMQLVKVLPMKFDSYYVSLLSEKYKTGKMNYVKALWIGWRSNVRAKQTKEYSSHIYVLKNMKNVK
ncbi:class I SAM-dependent methyltransferase [Flavobacterium sp.]|jgi:2-polyprenyl-3-methyl-5-hydroxy-6-metoxy-1,4-benzoquinol methylase|uniref:class I SAM-dependent methyltransferase n=1 Tax=Flavobacterium sp. TaxID=239 RepID=UPI0022C7B44A|nr:class I SAM-dependent methyltransferase [Flavobacterium sp.]MCZ8144447.1 class I SAM-dependent methyltransferase [Flavobacterium sp.]MCZ8365825.1 class I SAM-dependent methyltransferase [Flavobacterium sp.]